MGRGDAIVHDPLTGLTASSLGGMDGGDIAPDTDEVPGFGALALAVAAGIGLAVAADRRR